MAAHTSYLDSQLVTRSVNYHGPKLLKHLTVAFPNEIKDLDLQAVNHKVYQARLPEISKQTVVSQETLRNFLCTKADRLFNNRVISPYPEDRADDYGLKDRVENLPSLDHYMKIPRKMKVDFFYKNVKRGDLLYVRVVANKDLTSKVRVMATLSNPPKDYSEVEIIAHLRTEDTRPHAECTDNGKWAIRSRLCVEVLTVVASENYMLVGTQGVTVGADRKDYSLGKFSKDSLPPIFNLIASGSVATYSQALARLKTFNNPRSIKHMAGRLGIDLSLHSSMHDSLRYRFPEKEMYKQLRKAQVTRWAHKSVADGLSYFKKRQYEEAFQCLNKAFQIDDSNVEAYVAKGALLANMGKFGKAVEEFEQALKYNAKHQNAIKYICETLVEYGKQLEEEENMDKAEQMYKRCLEVNPNHEAGKATLEALNLKLGRVPPIVEEAPMTDALRDLVTMELEFQRKCKETLLIKDLGEKEILKAREKEKVSPAEKNVIEKATTSKVTKQQSVVEDEVKKKSPKETRSPRKSLSPLSKKFALQEGRWQPPPNIKTTSSFLGPQIYPPHSAPVNIFEFCSIPPTFNTSVPPPYPFPPTKPPQNVYENQASTSSVADKTKDEEYNARVEQFLREISTPGDGDRQSRERSKKSRKKKSGRKVSRKRSKRRKRPRSSTGSRSRKSSSSSSSSSRSSSSNSSSSSSSSSSTSSSSSSSSSGSKKSKSGRKSRSQSRKIRSKTSREKLPKLPMEPVVVKEPVTVKKEVTVYDKPVTVKKDVTVYDKPVTVKKEVTVYDKPVTVKKEVSVSDDRENMKDEGIPGLQTLEAKLSAYYEKVRASQVEPSQKSVQEKCESYEKKGSEDSDSFKMMMETFNRYAKGFRLSPKQCKNSRSQMSNVHPVFKNSLSESQKESAETNLKQKKEELVEKISPPYPYLDSYMSDFVKKVELFKKVPTKSPAKDSSHSPSSKRSQSRSRSESRSKVRRRHSRSKSREKGVSRVRERCRSRSRSRSRRKSRSRPRYRSRSMSRPRSSRRSSSRLRSSRRSRSGSRPRSSRRSRSGSRSRGSHENKMSKSVQAAAKRINMQIKFGIAEKVSNSGGNRLNKCDELPKSSNKIRSRWDSPSKMSDDKHSKWDSLSEIENFVAAAQQKKLEEIRERNKKFLRNSDK